MYRNETRTVTGVTSIYLEPRSMSVRVKRQRRGLFDKLFGEEYEWTSVPDLPILYLNGAMVGTLHAHGPAQALAVKAHLDSSSKKPLDLQLECHYTESGFYVDSVKILAKK